MRYFQAILRKADGTVRRSGAYRQPHDDDPSADQMFNAMTHTWVATSHVRDAEFGYRDGEFAEVTEGEIRQFLAARFPDLDADRILAEPAPARARVEPPTAGYPKVFEGGAQYIPIERSGAAVGALWWSDDDVAAGVQWHRAASRDDVPTDAMEWWWRRLREAAAAGLAPSSLVESLPDRPASEAGLLRRDLAGRVGSHAELRSLAPRG